MEKQTILRRSEVYPILETEGVQVRGNDIEVTLENKGKGAAYFIGLHIQFYLLRILEKRWHFIDKLVEVENEKKRKVYPRRHVILLRNQKGQGRLLPNDGDTFKARMSFLFSYRKKEFGAGRWRYFDDMRALMVQNKVRFVAVMMRVAYKDLAESITEYEMLKSIIVDIQKHRNLEDAVKDNIPFTQRTLDWETEAEWMNGELYETGKSQRGLLDRKF